MSTVLVYILLCVNFAYPAKILGVFLINGYSHTMVFSSIINDLARRGHDITLITIDQFPIEEGYQIRQINFHQEFLKVKENFPEVYDTYPPRELTMEGIRGTCQASHEYLFNSPEIQELLNQSSGENKFDLVIAEYLMVLTPLLKELFKAPVIAVSNVYIPEFLMHRMTGQLKYDQPAKTFAERMMTWRHHLENYFIMEGFSDLLNEETQKYAPEVTKTAEEMRSNTDLILFVDIPGFLPARSLPRYVIPIGPTHFNDSSTLTKELKDYLDNSTQGVVYVSMGTIVALDNLPLERKQQFLEVFQQLPYNFILKCGKCDLSVLPNVKVVKWVDQVSLLGHPNIKAFVSHGGYQSTLEAVYQAIPMVVFPHVFDQERNADQIATNDMGLKLDITNFAASDLAGAIVRVIQDPKYKENMMDRSIALRTQPIKGVDMIAFWVDYLAKHKHVKFLHGESKHLPFIQFFNLDIILFHIVIIVGITFVIIRRC